MRLNAKGLLSGNRDLVEVRYAALQYQLFVLKHIFMTLSARCVFFRYQIYQALEFLDFLFMDSAPRSYWLYRCQICHVCPEILILPVCSALLGK